MIRKVGKKLMLARTDKAPETDSKVYDSKGKIVGEVYEVFGPVKEPYVLIKINENTDLNQVKKSTIYFQK